MCPRLHDCVPSLSLYVPKRFIYVSPFPCVPQTLILTLTKPNPNPLTQIQT